MSYSSLYNIDDDRTLPAERVLCNDVTFPDEYNPHNVRLWVIGNEFGVLVLVWGSCEGEALDVAADAGLLNGLALDDDIAEEREREDDNEGVMYLGNAGEAFDSIHAWIQEAPALKGIQARWFAEARGQGAENLGEV